MHKYRSLLLLSVMLAAVSNTALAADAPSVEIWHSELVFANQGMCAAHFTVDAGFLDSPIHDLSVQLQGIDRDGKVVVTDTLVFEDEVGGSSATRYGVALHESEAACEDNLRIDIVQAVGQVDGRQTPVTMVPRDFRLYRITVKPPTQRPH